MNECPVCLPLFKHNRFNKLTYYKVLCEEKNWRISLETNEKEMKIYVMRVAKNGEPDMITLRPKLCPFCGISLTPP